MDWTKNVSKFLDALWVAKFPEGSICHHLGVTMGDPGIGAPIGLMPRGPNEMLFTIYGREYGKGFSKRTFDKWRKGISKFGNIVDEWNGKPGMSGISIVLKTRVPAGFIEAIANYHNMKSVFRPTKTEKNGYEAFHKALDDALKSVGFEYREPRPKYASPIISVKERKLSKAEEQLYQSVRDLLEELSDERNWTMFAGSADCGMSDTFQFHPGGYNEDRAPYDVARDTLAKFELFVEEKKKCRLDK